MIKLVMNTSAKLDSMRASLRATEARLVQLAADRAAAVADDSDVKSIRTIDAAIEESRRDVAAYADKIVVLEARLAAEEQTRRAAEHAAGIERFGKTLAPIGDAAAAIEEAVRALAAAVNRYERAAATAAAAWPAGVVAWNAHHLSGGRLGELLQECLAPGGLCRRRGSDILPGPGAREFTDKAATADQRCAGFGNGERAHHAALMEDLRAQPVPEPALVDDEQAAA